MKNHTCCFTGHRKIPSDKQEIIAERLRRVSEQLISEGVTQFMSGGALGFDTMAAQCILSLKEKYPYIKLILALPCTTQTKGWSREDIFVYNEIKECADKTIYISQEYTKGCMFRRNRYLADNSSICVAYLTEGVGGTAYTVNYAEYRGLKIINIGS